MITSDTIKCCFKNYMKQHGAVLAKGWLLGLQFYAMFNSGEYFTGTARANEYAYMLKKAFAKKNIPFYVDSNTNQQFVLLTKSQQNKLAEKYLFEKQGIRLKSKDVVRFCTSWATEKADIESLIADIADL